MAKRKPSLTSDETESLESAVVQLTQEVRVLRQAFDEFRVDFTHLLRNLPDNLPPPYQHLTTLAESFALEHVADRSVDAKLETLCCYECDTDAPASLAQALQNGWIDIGSAEDAHAANYVGWCPACQRAHEEVERRVNAGPVHPQVVAETRPVVQAPAIDKAISNTETAGSALHSGDEETATSLPTTTQPSVRTRRSKRRKELPIALHIIQDPPYTDIVRFIGYGNVTLDKYDAFTQTLVERYGQQRVFDACQDLTEHVPGKSRQMQLTAAAKANARQVLGPQPESRAAESE